MLASCELTAGVCTQVDVADFSGPAFSHVDNRFAALTLVQKNLCDAALFSPSGALPQRPVQACRHVMMKAPHWQRTGKSLCHFSELPA